MNACSLLLMLHKKGKFLWVTRTKPNWCLGKPLDFSKVVFAPMKIPDAHVASTKILRLVTSLLKCGGQIGPTVMISLHATLYNDSHRRKRDVIALVAKVTTLRKVRFHNQLVAYSLLHLHQRNGFSIVIWN